MGYYRQIRDTYGEEASNTLKQWANISSSLASYRNRVRFLTQCKRHGVTPRHLSQNINVDNIELPSAGERREEEINKRLRLRILKLEISYTFRHIHQLENRHRHLSNLALEKLPHNIYKNFESRLKHNYNREFSRVGKNMFRKLNNLIDIHKKRFITQEGWLKNLTNKTLPVDIKKTLSLGPKFAYPPTNRDISIKHLLADVELAISWAPKETHNILRAKTTNVITNYMKKNSEVTNISTEMFKQTRKFLKQNPDIVVTNSDKGNVTVLMNKLDYNSKVMELLQDRNVYKILGRDPTQTFQNKNNEIVKILREKEYIDITTAKALTTYKAVAPRLYGLPKVHKQDIPMRPIVSTINSPTSAISKWVANILKTSFEDYNEYAVKNSFEFAEKTNDFQLPEDHVVVSLDVVSLFTNISLELTLHIIQEEWTRIEQHTNVPIEIFVNIIEFIFSANYFTYDNTCYTMIFGCPMGSCLSPILANIVMTSLIKSSLAKLSFTPPFIYQYVDDLLTAIPSSALEEILNTFNSFDEHLKFTAEEENERSVPFLDTKVIRRQDNVLILDWYQKKTTSGRYVHYYSYHEMKMKTNVILALKDRIRKIAHPTLYKGALARLKNILLKNGYPNKFLNKLLYNTRYHARNDVHTDTTDPRQQGSTTPTQEDEEQVPHYAVLPHINSLTSNIMAILKQAGNVRFAKYNLVTNKRIYSNLKDRVPTEIRSDVVYEIPCMSCSKKYIGQSSTMLKKRLALHRSDIRLRPGRCTLAQHVKTNNHEMDFNNTKILTQEKNYNKRTFLEMCYINECEDPINAKTDMENLSIIYSSLLLEDSKKKEYVSRQQTIQQQENVVAET